LNAKYCRCGALPFFVASRFDPKNTRACLELRCQKCGKTTLPSMTQEQALRKWNKIAGEKR
jgi:hypothetical protein